VYVTHDQAEAMALSDRIAVLNAGKIEQVGTPEDIYCRPQTRFVAEFIGRANIITGIVRSCDDGNFVLHALGTALTIPTRGGEYYPGQQATIVIRPEMIEVNVQRPQVMGIVRQVIYLGNVTQYQVDVHDHMITLFEHGPRHSYDYSSGQDIPLRFLESCLYVLPAKMSNPIGVAA
jgi:iron(III) transport system ATP-binding protein